VDFGVDDEGESAAVRLQPGKLWWVALAQAQARIKHPLREPHSGVTFRRVVQRGT